MQENEPKAGDSRDLTESEDDLTSECCPICKDKECKKHLLACFDASGDQGALGVGLAGGPLYYVNEIEEVLQRTRLAWVQSVRATGKPKAPRWIMKERDLRDYYDALGGSGGFDLVHKQSDERAADFLPAYTDNEIWHARDEFLDGVLSSCGWNGERTEEPFDSIPGQSTTYLYWWALEPSQIVKRFRAKLQRILLEATNTVKATKRKSTTRAKKAKRIKAPTRMAKTAGAKKSSFKRTSKRKSAR
jgi:hypothetical protein